MLTQVRRGHHQEFDEYE